MLSASLIGNAQRPTAHPATLDVFQRLRWFNFLMGLLHTGQGIAILLLSTGFSLPVTAAFLEFDTTTWSLNPSLETLAELQIGPMVSTFLLSLPWPIS